MDHTSKKPLLELCKSLYSEDKVVVLALGFFVSCGYPMVRRFAPLALMLSALFTVVLSLFGEDSYSRLEGLKKGVMLQQEENATLLEKVTELREEVAALRNSPRALEKAARNELGLARPQEQVFIFERRAEKKSVCPASKNCEASDAL